MLLKSIELKCNVSDCVIFNHSFMPYDIIESKRKCNMNIMHFKEFEQKMGFCTINDKKIYMFFFTVRFHKYNVQWLIISYQSIFRRCCVSLVAELLFFIEMFSKNLYGKKCFSLLNLTRIFILINLFYWNFSKTTTTKNCTETPRTIQ